MASETVLVPRDRYDRLLKISELYNALKKATNNDSELAEHPDDAKPKDKGPGHAGTRNADDRSADAVPAADGSPSMPPATESSATAQAGKADDAAEHTAPSKKPKAQTEPSPPPGLPMSVVKQGLRKVRKDLKSKRAPKANHAKKASGEWQTW